MLRQAGHFPALTILSLNELVGGGVIAKTEVGAVPVKNSIRKTTSDGSQQDGFSQGASVVEVGCGLTLATNGVRPLLIVIFSVDLRDAKIGELAARPKLGHFSVGTNDHSVLSNETAPVLVLVTCWQFDNVFGWQAAAIVPGDFDGI